MIQEQTDEPTELDWNDLDMDDSFGKLVLIQTVLEGTEIHLVQQHHGSLFVDNDVKMHLKMELTR